MKTKIIALIALVLMISSALAIQITDRSPNNDVVNNIVGDSRIFQVQTDHTANFSWSINNSVIDESEINGVENVTVSSYTNESAKLGTWKIKVIATNTSNSSDKKSNIWTWKVIANNSNNNNSQSNTTPKISNISVTDIKDTSIRITFIVNQSDAKTVVKYGTTSLDKSKWDNSTGLSRSIYIDNLTKNTGYNSSIYAYNGTNQSLFSNTPSNFKTLDAKKPVISNINADNITQSSADILFTVDQKDAKTKVNYGINPNSLTNDKWDNGTTQSRKITISNLLNNTKYYYLISAYNSTNQNYYDNSTVRNLTTKYSNPKITNTTPPDKNIETIGKEPINFTVSFDQIVNVTWFLNNSLVKSEKGVKFSYYYNDTPSVGTWNVTVVGTNKNGTVSNNWTWSVRQKTFKTGNRIWDEGKGMSTTYRWDSYSFSGFYYDLDENLKTEEFEIKDIDRNIAEGDITYETSPQEVSFGYKPFGKYNVIGFMAEKYFAGYTDKTNFTDKAISTIGDGQLHKIILDDDTKRAIYVGSTLTLGEGYVLKMKEIDVGSGPGQIWVTLLKDGNEVDDDVIAGGENYIYEKKVGTVDDLPIIAVHFDSVFRGREANAAFVKGIFQISAYITSVKSGDRYDRMKVTSISTNKIVMENRENIGLDTGDTISLMGNLKIIVADSPKLRFELSVERTGTFEARGTVYNAIDNDTTDEWTPMNFGLNVGGKNIGFYYDLDEDIGTESLKAKVSGRNIPEGKLAYSTSPQEVSFGYEKFGKYNVIGFMADKYFAGYTGKTDFTSETISTIGDGQLHKVVFDDDEKRTIYAGSTLTLGEGYILKLSDVDVGAGPGRIWLKLFKDGNEVDNDIIAGGENYIYEKKVGTVDDLPIIAVHFDSVFRGREANAAFVKGIFQISSSYIKVKSGDKYDKMKISGVSENKITMENEDNIDLSAGDEEKIMGNIKFKVADSSDVRFYPFVTVTSEMIANQLVIDIPSKETAGNTITIKVTAGGEPTENVSISIEPGIGLLENRTDTKGIINYTIPIVLKGTYNITATKVGYEKAIKNIEILQYVENRLSIDSPLIANQFETIMIKVTANGTAISGASLSFDNITIGVTDINGLNYTLKESGTHTIFASKTGYVSVMKDIEVKVPYSEFHALDINISPISVFENEDINVKSNITNVGTKTDTKPVELIVNDTVVDNKSITLAPKETKEINFTYKASLPEGNYTVEILEQKGLLEVKKAPWNILLIGTILTIVGVIIIYITTRKEKIAELIKKYKNKIQK